MSAPRKWTATEDARLREIAGTIPSERIAEEFGCHRQTILAREMKLGIKRHKRGITVEEVLASRSKYEFERGWWPLEAGHPVCWQLLMALTPSIADEPSPWAEDKSWPRQ